MNMESTGEQTNQLKYNTNERKCPRLNTGGYSDKAIS